MTRAGGPPAWGVRAVVAGALVVLAGCGPFRDYCLPSGEAVQALRALAAGLPAGAATPGRRPVAYAIAGRRRSGDLYLPAASPPRAGLVLVPGAATGGKDDRRLVALAAALARVGFAVLVPDIPSLRELRAAPSDVRDVADAFAYLLTRPDLSPDGRAGLGGISYAVGPALLAALEPALRERVRFVLGVGGYHDLTRVIAYFTTGRFQDAGGWRYMRPNEYGKWVFVMSNLGYLPDPADRQALKSLAERKLAAPTAPVEPPPLGPGGRALWALLANADPTRVPALVAALPAGLRRDVAALDLSNKDLGALKARVILVHGRDDDIIPYTESVALARALPPSRVRLFVVDGLFHVNLADLRLDDAWRLSCAIDALLAERRP